MRTGKIMVCDVDEVLVVMSGKWVGRARLAPFSSEIPALASLPSDPASFQEAIHDRPAYLFLDWLGVPHSLREEFDKLYTEDGAFYDDLPHTSFCQSVLMALTFPGAVDALHLVTHMKPNNARCNASKVSWLSRTFSRFLHEDRIMVHSVEGHQKKSAILRKYCPEPDVFADDAMANVMDVLSADGVRPAQVLLPKMGHNEAHPSLRQLAQLKRVDIQYYANRA